MPLLRNAIRSYINLSLASPISIFDLTLHPISLTIARLVHSCLLSIQRDSIVFGRLSKTRRSRKDRNLTSQLADRDKSADGLAHFPAK